MAKKKQREDVHRPGAIEPKDYAYVGVWTTRWEYTENAQATAVVGFARARVLQHMATTGGKWATHEHGGTCMVCGARAIYLAVFYHGKSNSYVVTGEECAVKMGADAEAFRKINDARRAAQKARSGYKKAEGLLLQAELGRAWEVYAACRKPDRDTLEGQLRAAGLEGDDLARAALRDLWIDAGLEPDAQPVAWGREEVTICDIVDTVAKKGRLSPKQSGYLGALLDRIDARPKLEERKRAEKNMAEEVPVTQERLTLACEVISVGTKENPDGSFRSVMTVKSLKHGFKLWGTRPAALHEVEKGQKILLTAGVQRSDKDPKFGFFSRPSGRLLREGEVV